MAALRALVRSSSATLAGVMAFVLLLPLAARPARADVAIEYHGPDRYELRVSHVTDFDQKRTTLPLEGIAYCVPASAVNWMAYFANHGAPWVYPGPGYWQSQSRYDDATDAIFAMSLAMATNPERGTNGRWVVPALRSWLQGTPTLIVRHYSTRTWSPRYDDAAAHALLGGYVMVGVGWYEIVGEGRIHRNRGHNLSLTYAWRDGQQRIIGWRDPASGDLDRTRQALFTTERYSIVDEFRLPTYVEGFPRFMSRPVGYGYSYVDSVTAIYPLFTLATRPDERSARLVPLAALWGSVPDLERVFESAELTRIRDLVIHPDLLSFCYVADATDPDYPPKMWRVSRLSGEAEEIDPGLQDPYNIGPIMFARQLDLYVADGNDLVLCDVDRDPPELMRRVTPPNPVSALTYDDEADDVILLSIPGRFLARYAHDLGDLRVKEIPPEVRLEGRVRIRWDALRECVWGVTGGSKMLFRLYENVQGELLAKQYGHPLLREPCDDVDVDDRGRLYLSFQGKIVEFELGLPDDLVLVDDPYFRNVEAGDVLRVARSATNFDPDIHVGPEWEDELPDEFGDPIYDCPEDLDGNRIIDFDDLLVLLSTWGPCPGDAFCDADFDYSTEVGFDDLLMLLSAWGPCP